MDYLCRCIFVSEFYATFVDVFFLQLQINDQRFEDAEEEQESHEDGH
jgi:hypothetical protein